MSSNSITVSLSNTARNIDPYWVRIEQNEQENEQATVSDAANLLDALFGIEPCNPEERAPDAVTAPSEPAVTEDEAVDLFDEILRFSTCVYDPDFGVNVDIKVIRSHRDKPYRLNLVGGRIVKTVETRDRVIRTLPLSDTVTLDYPLTGNLVSNFRPLSIVGNTLTFSPEFIDSKLIAEFDTIYDLVTIHVSGVGDGPGECTALAFYHGLVEEQQLNLPDVDPAAFTYCTSSGHVIENKANVTCYESVVVTKRCSCDKKPVGEQYTFDRVVDCPDQLTKCPNNQEVCSYNLGTVAQDEYVECTGDTTNYHNADFYNEVCCGASPKKPLPKCKVEKRSYLGGVGIQGGEQQYKDFYGGNVKFTPVTPSGGVCGEWTITQKISAACCELATLEWDEAHPLPEVMSSGDNAYIYFNGVVGPYSAEITGAGITFTDGYKTKTLADQSAGLHRFEVMARSGTCGTSAITISDGCGNTLLWEIRGSVGSWVLIHNSLEGFLPCPLMGDCSANFVSGSTWEIISGGLKMQQNITYGFEYPAIRDYATVLSLCQSWYQDFINSMSATCAGNNPTCVKCFRESSEYTPCHVYSSFPPYDPASTSSCNRNVFAYIGLSGGWYYTKAHTSTVTLNRLYEWRC
jgi:hypothetical protein